jgi:tRNA(fMet)-specific endonuclease VapC
MTTQVFMLDTDIVSYIVSGRSHSARTRLAGIDAAQICVSVITRAELVYGLKRLPSGHPLHAGVRGFLDRTTIQAWDGAAADIHADLRHQLQSTSRGIGELDLMIAAHAIALDAVLVTNNTRHFGRIAPPLLLENWALPPD